ncbi:MAG: ABC transporter ATP-binding protein [Gammaproteobacteria bacterium]|nr:MAG: ABC transporter ATP-binding protein [Gammaproteobacteria bacterium]
MISLKNITKMFGSFTAVNDLSFTVESGEVLGFLGPNGAGKSTTMKMITGFLTPSDGQITVGSHDITEEPVQAKSIIGYLPEGAPAYGDMTPEEFLIFIAKVRGLTGSKVKERIDAVIKQTHIQDVLFKPIDTLSKGYKRRVGLAQAIIHDPKILILDEPTDGLDPNQKYEVRKLIKAMAEDKTIIVSTHILEEVSAVCSRAIVIDKGSIVAYGKPHELEERSQYYGAVTISFSEDGDFSDVITSLEQVEGATSVKFDEITERFTTFPTDKKNGTDLFNKVSALVESKGWDVKEIHLERGRFDDFFRSVTAGDLESKTEEQCGDKPSVPAKQDEGAQQ